MHKEDIKAMLRKEFGSLTAFEREFDLPRLSTSSMLRGKTSWRVAAAISEVTGVPIQDLFPNKFPRPQRRGDEGQAIPKSGSTHRQNDGSI